MNLWSALTPGVREQFRLIEDLQYNTCKDPEVDPETWFRSFLDKYYPGSVFGERLLAEIYVILQDIHKFARDWGYHLSPGSVARLRSLPFRPQPQPEPMQANGNTRTTRGQALNFQTSSRLLSELRGMMSQLRKPTPPQIQEPVPSTLLQIPPLASIPRPPISIRVQNLPVGRQQRSRQGSQVGSSSSDQLNFHAPACKRRRRSGS